MSRRRRRRPSPQRSRGAPARKESPSPRRIGLVTGGMIAIVIVVLVVLGLVEQPATPVERDPETIAAGETLYTASCAVCHGPDLQGSQTGPPLLVPTYAPNHHGDEAFQRAVALGVVPHHWNFGPMAPLPGLDRDDVSKIIAYVRNVQEAAGIFRDPTHPGG